MIEIVQGRANLYRLLGRVWAEGVTAELWPYIGVVDLLREAAEELGGAKRGWSEWGADQQAVLAFELLPYEGSFLDGEGMLGREVSDRVARAYGEVGYGVPLAASSPDHIGYELGMMAYLCEQEAAMLSRGEGEEADLWRERQEWWYRKHVGRWWPPLAAAVTRVGHPFYGALTEVTGGTLRLHELGGVGKWKLVGQRPLLSNPKTSLKDIAQFLVTPAQAGGMLAREEILGLARRWELPRGFGGRGLMLTHALRAAGRFEAWEGLLSGLEEIVASWIASYGAWGDEGVVWIERAEATLGILAELKETGRAGVADEGG
ncbi:MAG TPA: molecular chaperone TorD family protein [Anaerolineae bacterium]|nr:molecular chaperone TorD family protein [Anaerolineae bacterium]